MKCPYCGDDAKLVRGAEIYPHRPDLAKLRYYQCKPCDAYVGCHRGSTRPLGRLANATLRQAKMKAHAAFDPIWMGGVMSRSQAYAWLAESLTIAPKDCHIGMFDVDRCGQVVNVCLHYRKTRNA